MNSHAPVDAPTAPQFERAAREPFRLTARHAAIIAGVWVLTALFNTNQTYLALDVQGRHTSWLALLRYGAPGMVMWALFTPAIMWLVARLPSDWRAIPAHLAGALTVCSADAGLYTLVDPFLSPTGAHSFYSSFVRYLAVNVNYYCAVVAIAMTLRFARQVRERRVVAAELQSQLATAHLRSLQAQLRPHFLFNTLNTIAEVAHRDLDAADRLIASLGSLLRRSFDTFAEQEVPLEMELEFLSEYAEIIETRFRGRIAIAVHAAPEARQQRVPSLLLQPLVENAVRHGLEPRLAGGTVEVDVWRAGDVLHIEVRDDGCGFSEKANAGGANGNGVGLTNTAHRLRHLYGDAQRFSVAPRPGGGSVIAIELPATGPVSPTIPSLPRAPRERAASVAS